MSPHRNSEWLVCFTSPSSASQLPPRLPSGDFAASLPSLPPFTPWTSGKGREKTTLESTSLAFPSSTSR